MTVRYDALPPDRLSQVLKDWPDPDNGSSGRVRDLCVNGSPLSGGCDFSGIMDSSAILPWDPCNSNWLFSLTVGFAPSPVNIKDMNYETF